MDTNSLVGRDRRAHLSSSFVIPSMSRDLCRSSLHLGLGELDKSGIAELTFKGRRLWIP